MRTTGEAGGGQSNCEAELTSLQASAADVAAVTTAVTAVAELSAPEESC